MRSFLFFTLSFLTSRLLSSTLFYPSPLSSLFSHPILPSLLSFAPPLSPLFSLFCPTHPFSLHSPSPALSSPPFSSPLPSLFPSCKQIFMHHLVAEITQLFHAVFPAIFCSRNRERSVCLRVPLSPQIADDIHKTGNNGRIVCKEKMQPS